MREDWVESTLGEICDVNMGQSPPSSTYNTEEIGLPFFQGKTEFTDLYPIVKKWCSKPKKVAKENDILLSVRAPVGSTNMSNQECAIGRGLAAITYSYFTQFAWYFLKLIEKKLDSQGTGTTFRAISGHILKSQTFPLPPLPEQRAIVAKIEELFSDLDKGIADLKKAQAQLKVYRQAVLKKAFEGELTNSKIQLQEDTLENTVAFTQGVQVPKTEQKTKAGNGDVRFLRIIDFTQGKDEPRFTSNPGDKYFVTKDDISMVRYGATGFVCSGIEGVIANNMFRIIPKSSIIKRYLYYFFKSPVFYQTINSRIKGVAMPAISFGLLNDIVIKYPKEIKEQHQIVQEIESRLSVCDKVEQTITESLEKAKALRQSILKKAFAGSLLSAAEIEQCKQAPDYEPASVLLEKIKAEKEKK